ncbi:hypothetical protein BDV28DRAFT_134032 [Aspergillus coremiiformis]|uniref:Uncharacterized protein n=1 Tax=Aspergillus coremiiformis TaxID=138285 RepID=A0A5N6Z6E1_9EURO|nr:hypothetical protein BDV28DRAFT_134032 [Aspergillus coremiiformis]
MLDLHDRSRVLADVLLSLPPILAIRVRNQVILASHTYLAYHSMGHSRMQRYPSPPLELRLVCD